jgi:hypothetical protein
MKSMELGNEHLIGENMSVVILHNKAGGYY